MTKQDVHTCFRLDVPDSNATVVRHRQQLIKVRTEANSKNDTLNVIQEYFERFEDEDYAIRNIIIHLY